MTDDIGSNALQATDTGHLSLTDLIETAAQLSAAGQVDKARQLYHAWIERNPGHPQLYVACFNGAALDSQAKDLASAAQGLNKAIALNPDFIPAYINLGRAFEESGAPQQAVDLWQQAANRAVPINGSAVGYTITALTQMARVLSAAQQSELAENAFHRCLEINPQQPDIIEQYTALRLSQCKWPIAITTEHFNRKALLGGINPLSMAAYTDDPLLQLASSYRYVKRSPWDGPHDSASDRRHEPVDLGNRRLRIGYVSSDLRDHAIGYLMAELFELHNRSDVEVFAYYCGPESNSALTHRIKAAVEHWVDIRPMSDDQAAARVAADGIDILVDINGHTRDARTGLFARHVAPIQVNWLGYPGSMGSPYHHYIIADDWIIPPGSELYYSEKVVRLPCYQPNDRKRGIAAQQPSRSDAGLPDNAFVFCCFNGTHKISRFTFERWLEILGRVPNSVLWLLDTNEKTRENLRALAEQHGVAGSRLIFAPKMPNPNHLARYPLADLFLDSVPYGAHTTASDALWMGVPVLTLSGRCFASRVCGSLVRAAGLPELVCTSADAYVARAIDLAANRDEIEGYKARLRASRNSCLLFDTGLLVSRLEALYRAMCEDHAQGLVPQPDLANLDAYFDAGSDHDHDHEEVLKIADYHGTYREKLKRFHLARPLQADSRLWGRNEIDAADRRPGVPSPASFYPGDIESLRHQARLLNREGRTLECLETLLALKARGAGHEVLLDDIRAVIDPTIQGFNRSLATGQVEQAARYADALAALLPGNVAALNSALSCNVALGRKHQAAQLAASLVKIDPQHQAACNALADADIAPPAAPVEELHPLIQLRDLYDQASAILCAPLTAQAAKQVGTLLASARKLDIKLPDNSDLAGWEKHYRLAIKAIDLSVGADLKPSKEAKNTFAASSGKALNRKQVQEAAKALRAKAVFFAAADKAYIDLYGRQYVKSILEHSDVSSLIVLHVIGGAKTLPAVARSLGISSNRLILAGDDFDAASIKTKCYDAPPKGLSVLPIAHLQSVRFLRAGALLQALNLPVLVSDIDLILQRGIADLLQKFAGCDIVLNENAANVNAGSRFTANLLLLNPTRHAALFLRFMRTYLEKALSGKEVSRWIDQFALMQAQHYLAKHAPDARIGHFDVNADINNIMYQSWQENSFRFLSLYHGFDMSSLPRRSRPAKAANKISQRDTIRRARVRA